MSEEYLSVKEFAELAKISKQAAYQQIKGRLKSFVKVEQGKTLINKSAYFQYYAEGQSSQVDKEFSSQSSQVEQPKEQDNVTLLLDMLKSELEEKNKQIAIKDKQIQDLSDRLKEAMQLTKEAQYITAADKTAALIEAGQPKEDNIIVSEEPIKEEFAAEHKSVEELKKKGFFAKLFGNKGN